MKKEPLNIEIIREFIVAAHGNFEEVMIGKVDWGQQPIQEIRKSPCGY